MSGFDKSLYYKCKPIDVLVKQVQQIILKNAEIKILSIFSCYLYSQTNAKMYAN